jgi:hypothetical protein
MFSLFFFSQILTNSLLLLCSGLQENAGKTQSIGRFNDTRSTRQQNVEN